MTLPPFSGCVLTGGASRRMGTDKAVLEFEGRPLALIAAAALTTAGADHVFCLGGDQDVIRQAGIETHRDPAPGQGPLAAVIEAFAICQTDVLMVLACDLPHADADSISATLAGLDEAHPVALPEFGGRPQYLHAAYDRRALGTLENAFDRGVRSMRWALDDLDFATVEVPDPGSLADADIPDDLAQR